MIIIFCLKNKLIKKSVKSDSLKKNKISERERTNVGAVLNGPRTIAGQG